MNTKKINTKEITLKEHLSKGGKIRTLVKASTISSEEEINDLIEFNKELTISHFEKTYKIKIEIEDVFVSGLDSYACKKIKHEFFNIVLTFKKENHVKQDN